MTITPTAHLAIRFSELARRLGRAIEEEETLVKAAINNSGGRFTVLDNSLGGRESPLAAAGGAFFVSWQAQCQLLFDRAFIALGDLQLLERKVILKRAWNAKTYFFNLILFISFSFSLSYLNPSPVLLLLFCRTLGELRHSRSGSMKCV